jgi:hypothetical protein
MNTPPARLYCVRVYQDVPVLALSESEAVKAGLAALERGVETDLARDAACRGEIRSVLTIPEGWGIYPPLGLDSDKSCEQLVALATAPAKP